MEQLHDTAVSKIERLNVSLPLKNEQRSVIKSFFKANRKYNIGAYTAEALLEKIKEELGETKE